MIDQVIPEERLRRDALAWLDSLGWELGTWAGDAIPIPREVELFVYSRMCVVRGRPEPGFEEYHFEAIVFCGKEEKEVERQTVRHPPFPLLGFVRLSYSADGELLRQEIEESDRWF